MRPPESWKSARVTLLIAAVTALAWLLASAAGLQDRAAIWGGFIPARFGGASSAMPLAPFFLTPLTATLVHAGLVHITFNLLMHLFCGRSVEAVVGGRGLLILYMAGAYVAAASHYAVDPHQTVPMVGASGAISAVLGVYAMLFGRNKVKVGNPAFSTLLHVLWLAAAWVGLQILVGFTFETTGTHLAVAAHVGGFFVGLLLARPLLLLKWRGA